MDSNLQDGDHPLPKTAVIWVMCLTVGLFGVVSILWLTNKLLISILLLTGSLIAASIIARQQRSHIKASLPRRNGVSTCVYMTSKPGMASAG